MPQAVCSLCGEPMPAGEEMFKYHGYSGPCPKPPLKPAFPRNLFAWTAPGADMPDYVSINETVEGVEVSVRRGGVLTAVTVPKNEWTLGRENQ